MYQSIPSSFQAAQGKGAARNAGEGESQPLQDSKAPAEEAARWRLLASSIGLLADAYDIFTIDIVLVILGSIYGEEATSPSSKSLMVCTLLLGIIVGQLSFGLVADLVGRKWAFVTTAGLTILGAASSAFTNNHRGFPLPVQLALCRFVLGLGIGGEYPLSASVTAESTQEPEQRRLLLATVISMQGWGMLLSSLIALLALGLGCSFEVLWRLLLALGALPSIVAFYLRWQLHESGAFKQAQSARLEQGQASASRGELLRKLWPRLVGTSLSWLLMNMSLYSLGSFKSTVLNELMDPSEDSRRRELIVTCRFSACTSCFSIAGFTAALVMVNRMGCYWMQLMGFSALAVIFLLQAILSSSGHAAIWQVVILLGLVFFFQNFGPNTTTFVIPAEVFPTLVRATCHGVSAASGKTGALVGTWAFPLVEASSGMTTVYAACAVTAVCGALATYFLTPRSTLSLDSIAD